jgi:hypothetical protein
VADIEDFGKASSIPRPSFDATTSTQLNSTAQKQVKRKHGQEVQEKRPKCNFRQTLGNPPKLGTSRDQFSEWLKYHKAKWQLQLEFRAYSRRSATNAGISGAVRTGIMRQSAELLLEYFKLNS